MIFFIHSVAIVLAAIVLVLSSFLLLEVAAAFLPARKSKASNKSIGKICVIVPAHNEADILTSTLVNIKKQLREDDQLIVVADNCTDSTAEVAQREGAKCLERNDATNRGKGYALQFALDEIRANPPEVVVFSDADCQFEDGALMQIATTAQSTNRPVQALYLMKAPQENATLRHRVAEFAWLFINQVRMGGLQRLFDVTRMTGAGFAAPWNTIADLEIGSGEIVEDLALTFAFVSRGRAPMLCARARVVSEFPDAQRAQLIQSARWSVGSTNYARRHALGWLFRSFVGARPRLLGATIDLMIPPLTLFVAINIAVIGVGLLSLMLGSGTALGISLVAVSMTAGAIALGWFFYGRQALPPRDVGAALGVLLSRIKVFGREGRETTKTWTATRSNDGRD